jgi:ribose 5-phosphate isomerase B
MEKKIIIGSDHTSFKLKGKIMEKLERMGYAVSDIGTHSADPVDYPVIAKKLVAEVLEENFDRGVLLCGTGIGMSCAANRFRGIRAAVCESVYSAKMAAAHNNANVLCLGGRILKISDALKIISTWLTTPYEGGRHKRRLDMLDKMK